MIDIILQMGEVTSDLQNENDEVIEYPITSKKKVNNRVRCLPMRMLAVLSLAF